MNATDVGPAPSVLGGAMMGASAYAEFLGDEYLASYLPAGGGSVKMAVVGDADVAEGFERSLDAVSAQRQCQLVRIDAATTKVHLVEQVFFAVSRQVDWRQIAAAMVRAAYDQVAFPPGNGKLSVADVAAEYDLEPRELYRSVRRQLERTVLADQTLPRELRRALLRLAQVHLGRDDVDPAETQAVLSWLTGEPVSLRDLRAAMIYTRIGRSNARTMLRCVGRLLQQTGSAGLVLHLDLTRLAQARRPPVAERSGTYYTKAAVLDAYELVRQLIDATDDLAGMLVVAVIPPELVTDDKRGLPTYAALQLRVADEVRDLRRPNPFASLVRLDVRLEAVR